jgi:hypothetical protein
MKICKKQLIFAHPRIFGRHRLFDFDNHIAGLPDFIRRIENRRARFSLKLVGET